MRSSALLKAVAAATLVLLLLIPLALVRNVIEERRGRQEEAVDEVSGKWGGAQLLLGPVLTVPYVERRVDADGKVHEVRRVAQLLPERLRIEGTAAPSVRQRGIFEVVLYTARLTVTGTFPALDAGVLGVPPESLVLSEAALSVGLEETRGIPEGLSLTWNGAALPFRAGAFRRVAGAGVHAALPPLPLGGEPNAFSFPLTLQGSRELSFVPLGVDTEVWLTSVWQHPSFSGAFLPETRSLADSGFSAAWKVSQFGRRYGQRWTSADSDAEALDQLIRASAFGVTFFQPVDAYQQATRSAKYGVLFLTLTFGAFFLFEVFAGLRLHPLQYLLVGLSLCLFYLLLVSLSEQIGFGRAYLVSAAATILLITAYSAAVLARKVRAAVIGGLLSALYGYLFVLLRAEDYALLMGSLALFAILAAVMFLTRRVDWHSLGSPAAARMPPQFLVPPPPPMAR